MRAFFVESLKQDDQEVELRDEALAHLKVVRLQKDEEVMLLNGQGLRAKASLQSIDKKSAILKVHSSEFVKQSSRFDIALGLVKKDAFDLCLKMAVELGVARIYPLLSRYAQRYEINSARSERLLQQALEQSNGAWLPKLMNPVSVEELVDNSKNYSQVLVMGMQKTQKDVVLSHGSEILAVIGPEGGLSVEEEELILSHENSSIVHLPTPILRTPTALAAVAGVIFTKVQLLD